MRPRRRDSAPVARAVVRSCAVGALLLLLAPGAARGQAGAPAALEIVVVDASTGAPLHNAQVLLARTGGTLTNTAGLARFGAIRAASVQVSVRHVGYADRTVSIELAPGSTFRLRVPLELDPVVLQGVQTRVGAGPRSRDLRDFYLRARRGVGHYITRADIERDRPRDLSELMRSLPGLRLVHTPAGERPSMEAKTSAASDVFGPEPDCRIQFFLDGSPIQPIHGGVLGAEVALREVEGIEIYRRGIGAPTKYQRLNSTCGLVLIWKRERQ